jgi:hypothetical protein
MSTQPKRASGQRPKKRKFTGNIYTRAKNAHVVADMSATPTTSAKKNSKHLF